MKYFVFTFLLCARLAIGQDLFSPNYVIGQNSAAVAPCSTIGQSNGGVIGAQNCSLHRYWAGWFTATANRSVCSIAITIGRHGSPTANTTILLYTFNTGATAPGTLIASSSTSVAQSTLSTSDVIVNFTIAASLVSGTKYYIVMDTGAAGTATDYTQWDIGAVLGTAAVVDSDDLSTWTSVSTRGVLYETFQ